MTDTSVILVSTPMPNRKEQPSREKLSLAAIAVFGERGYHAARVSDIVGRAGVAQGTFYLHFESKEAIFLALIDDFFARLLDQTLGRFPASGLADTADLAVQIGKMWRAILGHCRHEPVLTTLVLRESSAVGTGARARVEARFAQLVAAIGSYLDAVSATGLIRQGMSDASAWALLGMLERAIHYAVVVNPAADIDALAEEFLRFELTGLLGAEVTAR